MKVASVASRLKEAMDIRGKKQVDLVRETKIDKASISSYISGRYEPKQAIHKLAIALNVSEMWLWGYNAPMERSSTPKSNDAFFDIGKMIRDARIAKGLTQEQLGTIAGVQKSAIAKYENGRVVNIKRNTLQKIAKALDLKEADLIFETNSDLCEVIDLYSSLDEDDKRTYKELLRRLVRK